MSPFNLNPRLSESATDSNQPRPTNLSSDWGKFAASDTKITAFALLGTEDRKGKPGSWRAAQPKFHNEVVLDEAEVESPEDRRELREAFALIVPTGRPKQCLTNYTHALRFEKDGRTLDAKICFGCGDMEISDKGKTWHCDLELCSSEIPDKFNTVFKRMGMKQFDRDAKR